MRHTFGILLARHNPQKQCIEFLMVQKPYCYGFNQLIMGRYRRSDERNLLALMRDMSQEDRSTLASLDFDKCYYRIYKRFPEPETRRHLVYTEAKAHFEQEFTNDPNKVIHRLLAQLPSGPTQWSIPAGHKINKMEGDLECALREFSEETRIPKSDLIILDLKPRVWQYHSSGNTYSISCFLAILANPKWHDSNTLRIDYRDPSHQSEVIDIKWMGLQNMAIVDNRNIVSFLRPMSHIFRKHRISRLSPGTVSRY